MSALLLLSLLGLSSGCGSRTGLFGGAGPAVGNHSGSGGSQPGGGGLGSGGLTPSGGASGVGGGSGANGTGGGGPFVCDPGTFNHDGDPTTSCLMCPPGSYSSVPDAMACLPWTECTWDAPEITPPSWDNDRTCGGQQSFRQFGTDFVDQAQDVAVDPAGNVHVSGFTYGSLDAMNSGDADGFVRQYSAAGEVAWGVQRGGPGFDSAFRLTLDAVAQTHTVLRQDGQTTLWMIDPQGTLLTEQIFGDEGRDVAVDIAGMRFFPRYIDPGDGTFDILLSKLGFNGSVLWNVILSGGDLEGPSSVEVLADGDVVLAGSTNGPLFGPSSGEPEAFVARFSTLGDLQWGVQFPAQLQTAVYGLAVDSVEQLYVVGSTNAGGTSPSDGFVAQVRSDGVLEWVGTYGTSAEDEVLDVTVDGQDQVTIVGTTWGAFGAGDQGEEDGFVARILPDGGLGQVLQFGTSSADHADAIAAAPDGALFVVGTTYGAFPGWQNAGSLDAYVGRLPPF